MLVLERGRHIGAPLCALYDGSTAARRGLDVVGRLAHGGEAIVFIVAKDDRVAERLEAEAGELLRVSGVRPLIRRLVGTDRKTIVAAVLAADPGLGQPR